MKRRDFLSITGTIGAAGITYEGCSFHSDVKKDDTSNIGFDLHPFLKNHPKAVFIYSTSVEKKNENEKIYLLGNDLAKELIVKTLHGFPMTSKVLIKPNWTNNGLFTDREKDNDILGVHTDFHFINGWMNGMRSVGIERFFLRDCALPKLWDSLGYRQFADENGYDLRDLSSKNVWEYKDGDINYLQISDGVMLKEIGLMSPTGDTGTFLVNIAKFKSHGMGITGTIKNLQGLCAHTFHTFCTNYDYVRKYSDPRYHRFFHDNFENSIELLYKKHIQKGISRWDRPGNDGGIWMETWVQRMLDALSVIRPNLNIIEGIYGHEGDGLGRGPYGRGKDIISNFILFGLDPIRLDIIAHWLAGHEPGNFGLFHIAVERGFSNIINPQEIPLFVWKDGTSIPTTLDSLKKTPLQTYYLARDYGRGHEPKYHLVDEECNY